MPIELSDTARKQVREVSCEAVKILADGTRVPLGTIAYWHRNPLKRWAHRIRQLLQRRTQ